MCPGYMAKPDCSPLPRFDRGRRGSKVPELFDLAWPKLLSQPAWSQTLDVTP